ncbi:MAG: ATP-dependent Clp protease proteolytic subunit [Ignavibacteriaceae bacterium]|jgi:Clp protease./Serine dehydrogenase proteinase.|nr:MAG: hypothetical protein EDM69_06940 [Chlorobiota bacterium]KXK06246.1 MAG: periplasmic ClpP class serine protease [Chlorobi bacterium OLB4]MBV6399242.1 hypothetical protein [Ignavibacteria bacterium]MCC6884915.1 ATP-dependent Clp protease proteolytic subunit [Ignavibacteriales bacterium]MCE7953554.1 hypothetical protein [Chlorobi bacterium CHB7]MDL1887556.1 hypothetical protein [Ignavibacteria bacterium CHB1]MEB2329316.1 ATP-dependent Clp protease proteolytic subunit [Ignavibacteriaceae 
MADKVTLVKPPIMYKEAQKVLREIESITGGKIISYYNSISGNICQNDVNIFHEIISEWDMQEDLYLLIKSDGGDGKASLRIINLLRQHTKRLTALIQGECGSAATMLALGAEEIQMGPLAYLTPIDTSITHELSPIDRNNNLVRIGHDELTRVVKLWNEEQGESNPYPELYKFIHPLAIGAVDRASSLSIRLCSEILSFHMTDKGKADNISKCLNSNYPSHSYPITIRESQRIGLNVNEIDSNVNNLLTDLYSFYSEMGKKAYTDYDENNYHDNAITNIIEAVGVQYFYQIDKDWHYKTDERRYIAWNDKSSWYRIEGTDKEAKPEAIALR